MTCCPPASSEADQVPSAGAPEADVRWKYDGRDARTPSRRGSEKTISTIASGETFSCPGGGEIETTLGGAASRTSDGSALSTFSASAAVARAQACPSRLVPLTEQLPTETTSKR